jgi:hypothetical protein
MSGARRRLPDRREIDSMSWATEMQAAPERFSWNREWTRMDANETGLPAKFAGLGGSHRSVWAIRGDKTLQTACIHSR